MEEITAVYEWAPFGVEALRIKYLTVASTAAVVVLIVTGAAAVRARLALVPGAVQSVAEVLVDWFDGLVADALGWDDRRYLPLIAGLFVFLLASNWIGMLPVPYLQEPTRDINTPMGMAILGFLVAHYTAVRERGWKSYLKSYVSPFAFMLPLNLVGEVAKIVSISFRLFGNIMGGAIIIIVVSSLVYGAIWEHLWLAPAGLIRIVLTAFFVIFVGLIQAFVFTMLTLVYIAVLVQE